MDKQPDSVINILMVEDDREFAHLVAEYFAAEGGFSVKLRHDGASGVVAAVNEPFDVIVLDVRLPGMDGLAAVQHFRQTCGPVPIVLVTAYGDEISGALGIPDNKEIVLGIALGYADPQSPINCFKTERENLDAFRFWYE